MPGEMPYPDEEHRTGMPILYVLALVAAGIVAPSDEGVLYVVVTLVAVAPVHILATYAGDAMPYSVQYRLRLVAGRLGWLTPDEMRPPDSSRSPTRARGVADAR
jgi:hypothetical protein